MIHKFVNTTPKPNATKNSSGELVGPFALLFDIVDDGAGFAAVAEVCYAAVASGNMVVD